VMKQKKLFRKYLSKKQLKYHDPTNKKDHIAKMVGEGISIKTILKEIEKCKVLCANCHRKIHYNGD